MAKVQHISGITKRLPFEDFDFYDLFRITFENSDKNITKMVVRQLKNAMTARLEPKRVNGKASCRTIQEELNDNP